MVARLVRRLFAVEEHSLRRVALGRGTRAGQRFAPDREMDKVETVNQFIYLVVGLPRPARFVHSMPPPRWRQSAVVPRRGASEHGPSATHHSVSALPAPSNLSNFDSRTL